MAFLDNLVSSLNQQTGITGGEPKTFDYDTLGPFAAKIDRSAHRAYLETGVVASKRPRIMEDIWQQPDITVVIKKKHFCSLAENFRLDLLNEDEKLYLKAVKRLVQKKCELIANYEKLCKFNYLATQGITSNYALPAIFKSVDFLNQAKPGLISGATQSTLEQIRSVYALSNPNFLTTWTTTTSIPSEFGDGTGTFELTQVSNASMTNSIKFGGGSADISFEDPYHLMIVSEEDIESVIADAASLFSSSFFKQTEADLRNTIDLLKQNLAQSRIARNVSQIKIIIADHSLLYKRVRAIMEEEGREINFTFDGGFLGFGSSVVLDPVEKEGKNALIDDEEIIFQQLIQSINILLGYQQTSESQIQQFNKKLNPVRQRMMMEFNQFPIVQQNDEIHIFISSKTQIDEAAIQGFNNTFANNSFLSKIDNLAGKTQDSLNDLISSFSGNKDSFIEQEKNAIAGEDFPLWLWYLVRNDFTREAAGVHKFAGVVTQSSQSYSNGVYTVRVSAKSNTEYFNLGQTNIKPALDAFDSSIMDPLTPFDLEFDAASGFLKGEVPPLLEENIRLLDSGLVRNKSGRKIGNIITKENYHNLEIENVASGLFRKKFNDPNGLVYKWKRGIQTQTLFGQPFSNLMRKETVPALTNDPFAGQDVVNVLSLLICGQPYNFDTFIRSALSSGNLTKDEVFNNTITNSYFRSLSGDLSKNNSLWGNFVPFKKLSINESGYNFIRSGEFELTNSNSKLNDLLRQRAKRFDALTSVLPQFANNPQFYKDGSAISDLRGIDINSLALIGQDIIDLDFQIDQQKKAFQENLKNSNIRSQDGSLRIIGDNIFFDPSVADESGQTNEERIRSQEQFRKKINSLTQRRLWKVKSNTDPNLLIIDDSYDKNYDIQAFERSLASGLSSFRSTYTKVGEKIEGIASMLGLEVFADTQGHIQIRPPQYNRIPSSVLAEILQNKKRKDVQLFPPFLESLFFGQVQGLSDRIEIVEDEIRLRAAAIGFIVDNDVKTLLSGAVSGTGSLGNTNFAFVTSEDGTLGSKDLRSLLLQAYPDLTEESSRSALSELGSILKTPNLSAINFDITQRIRVVNEQVFNTKDDKINDRINTIRTRLQLKTGITPVSKQDLLPNDKSFATAGRSQLDLLNITNQIAQFLSERQGLIKLLTNAVKNLDQGVQLNADPDLAKNILYPTINQSSAFPEILQHMIEDENFDDLGKDSGKRYVLTDAQIKSFTIDMNPPPFTVIEVNGALETGLVSGPSGLEIGQSGNGISTAIAVDNDMRRMYGFRGYNAVSVPFLSDPETQCAPYAVWLLNQARKNIIHASFNLIGNEYYQPGEVYYFEDRNLLFYCESITDSFSYGGEYSTSMNCIYGHSPGEFIPTMLDIIGKSLYTNKFSANLVRHVRNSSIPGEEHISILANENATVDSETGEFISSTADNSLESLVSGKFGEMNRKNLSTIIAMAGGVLNSSSTTKTKMELRIYHNSQADQGLLNIANGIKEWLINPSKATKGLSGKSSLPSSNISFGIDANLVEIISIDLSKQSEKRSPSSAAWSMARSISNVDGSESNELFTKVIDVWTVFQTTQETSTTSTSKQNSIPTNQADIAQRDKYSKQFVERLNQKGK